MVLEQKLLMGKRRTLLTREAVLRLPDWVETILPRSSHVFQTVHERMQLAILLSKLNMEYGTGGPFGAAVFDLETKKLLTVGVNIVVSAHCSIAHAEMLAFVIAQQRFGQYTLCAPGLPPCELVTSTEPCAMCLGALAWSGIRSLVCGAHDQDARRIGFDEGSKPARWVSTLERRGMSVTLNVCGEEARAVLEQYGESGGEIYNARGVNTTRTKSEEAKKRKGACA
jgi:tRNA(Arg) A34 adenosine deaminase TadA